MINTIFYSYIYYSKVIPSVVIRLSSGLPSCFMPAAKSLIKSNVLIHSERQPIVLRFPSVPSNPKDEAVTMQLLYMSSSPSHSFPAFAEP